MISTLWLIAALAAPADSLAPPDTLRQVVTLPQVEVSTARPGRNAPFARSRSRRSTCSSTLGA